MPIKGLTTDTQTSLTTALPLLATLRKGAPRPADGKRPGADLDYFRADFAPEYEHLAPIWTELYGPKPDKLPGVYLMAETPDEAFPTWLEEWSATKLLHRCDGEMQHRHYNQQTGEYSDEPRKCAAPACKCQRVGRLYLLIPEFVEATGMLGTVKLLTSSIHDILSIHNYLTFAYRTLGTLHGVKFEIGRVMREVTVPMNDKRAKVKKSLIYMTIAPDFMQTVMLPRLADDKRHLAAPASAPQLSATAPAHPDDAPDNDVIDGAYEEDDASQDVAPADRPDVVRRVMALFSINEVTARKGLSDRLADGTITAAMSDDEIVAALKARAESSKSATNGNGNGHSAPANAELPADGDPFKARAAAITDPFELAEFISNRVPGNMAGAVSAKQKQLIAMMVTEALPNDDSYDADNVRHIITKFLFEQDGVSALSKAQASAMLDWLTGPDGKLHPCVSEEIAMIVEFMAEHEQTLEGEIIE